MVKDRRMLRQVNETFCTTSTFRVEGNELGRPRGIRSAAPGSGERAGPGTESRLTDGGWRDRTSSVANLSARRLTMHTKARSVRAPEFLSRGTAASMATPASADVGVKAGFLKC